MKDSYLLAGCFGAGFLLTAGISLLRSGDFGEMPAARVSPSPRLASARPAYSFGSAPPRAATSPMNRAAVTPTQPDARPQVDSAPESAAPAQELTPETAQQPEQQARRLARRAAERDGH